MFTFGRLVSQKAFLPVTTVIIKTLLLHTGRIWKFSLFQQVSKALPIDLLL